MQGGKWDNEEKGGGPGAFAVGGEGQRRRLPPFTVKLSYTQNQELSRDLEDSEAKLHGCAGSGKAGRGLSWSQPLVLFRSVSFCSCKRMSKPCGDSVVRFCCAHQQTTNMLNDISVHSAAKSQLRIFAL